MSELFMQNKIAALGGLLIMAANLTATAQISMDGSLGPAGALAGPNYQVTADLGQQRGGNLFHSFGQFSIQTGETAAFSGPNSVSNIIGRVTGGQLSTIDGTLRSTIPNANLYLLNPAGVLFGEHAQIDVSGSFHVSTTDYLKLGDGGRFEARTPGNSVLTAAPIQAFGFLGNAPGKISISGGFLQVREGQTLSLIGGDISLTNATLFAPGGRINLAAVGSAGTVTPTADGLEMSGFTRLGNLSVSHDPDVARINVGDLPLGDVDASGRGGGAIFIRGANLSVAGGWLFADTYGEQAGIGIDMALSGDLRLSRNAQITSVTAGAGAAGAITLIGEQVSLDGGSVLATATSSAGNAGTITLDVKSLSLNGGSQIATITSGSGQGGSIQVTAHERVEIAGMDDDGIPSILHASAIKDSTGSAGAITVTSPLVSLRDGGGIYSDSEDGSGDAGAITLNVSQLSLSGGMIRASTFEAGRGGQLTITARDRIDISGGGATNGISAGLYTVATLFGSTGAAGNIAITSPILTLSGEAIIASITGGAGDAGDITLNVGELRLNSGSLISVGTFDTGKGGQLTVTARDRVEIAGGSKLDASALATTGSAGSIHLTSPVLTLSEDGRIESNTEGAGNAGAIDLHVGQLNLSSGGAMSVNTLGAGRGGSLSVMAAGRIDIAGADADGNLSGLSADAESGSSGSAGTITLVSPVLALDENGVIGSTTYGPGDAGIINLEVGALSLNGGSQIHTATAGSGSGGTLSITAHERIEIAGADRHGNFSLLSADALPNSTGSAGTIALTSPTVAISDGGSIRSKTYGALNAGDIALNVGRLSLRDGGQIATSTYGVGKGGSIQVTASEQVEIVGTYADFGPSGLFATSQQGATGNAGDITIQTVQLTAEQGGGIFAQAAAATGGAIQISADHTLLRNGGKISSTVLGAADSDGGNVEVNGDTLVILDSPGITAKAKLGKGGNIAVNTDVFLHNAESVDDVLNASSEVSGNNGSVTINSPPVDISGALVKTPAAYLDASGQLQRRCGGMVASERNQLTVPGRGALPPEPDGPLPTSSRCAAEPVMAQSSPSIPVTPRAPAQTVEATGWGDR